MRSIVATETMPATVKLVRETEEPASDPVGTAWCPTQKDVERVTALRLKFAVRSDVVKDTMSAFVLAREIEESSSRGIGQPTAECQLVVWLSRRRWLHGEVSSGSCRVEQKAPRSVSWRCTLKCARRVKSLPWRKDMTWNMSPR